jgi:hypothetical protein
MMTRTKYIRILKISLSTLAILFIAGYALSRSLPYARGPAITVFQPVSGASTNARTVEVVGRAERVISVTLNGNQISIDEQGNFKETIGVFRGLNVITVQATDRFGRIGSEEIRVLGI